MASHQHHNHGDCKEIFALLSDYLDLELPPEACGEIENHLKHCPTCIEFVESLRKTVQVCRGYEPGELPGPLEEDARRDLLAAYQRMLQTRGK
jgi:anti-sigma factor RsiW